MDEPTQLSKPEHLLKVTLSLHDGGRRGALLAQSGVLPLLMQVGENLGGWTSWGTFQAGIAHSYLGRSPQCFGWMWEREGGRHELELGQNFWILVLQVGLVNILKISG